MRITKTIERPDGAVTFQANLDPVEVGFLLEYAIMDLIEKGAAPFALAEVQDPNLIHDAPETTQ